ncbi:MAG: isoamylase early set domain-containing protein [Kineosporiaceae bacterium]
MHKSRLDDGSVLVAFELPAAVAATSVNLVGDFNDWSPDANPLALLDDGGFRTEVTLPAGRRARFRYLLDGQRWENDWAADDYVPNGLGTEDSVVDLTRLEAIAETASEVGSTEDLAARTAVSQTPAPDAAVTTSRPWWQFWTWRLPSRP